MVFGGVDQVQLEFGANLQWKWAAENDWPRDTNHQREWIVEVSRCLLGWWQSIYNGGRHERQVGSYWKDWTKQVQIVRQYSKSGLDW